MDFWKTILGLTRRKLFIIPLLAAAIAVAVTGYLLTPPRYVSSTTMVLVPPTLGSLSQDPTKPIDLTNPMLSFNSNLKTASAILIQSLNTPEAAAGLGVAKGGPTQLTIDDGRTNPDLIDSNGPFVYVICESPSPATAKEVVVQAQNRMRRELVDRQKSMKAPAGTYLTIVDVVAPTVPKVTRSAQIKVGASASVLLLASGLGIAYARERVGANRRRVADSELLPTPNADELDASRDSDRGARLDVPGDESPAEEVAARSDTDSGAGEQAGKRDAEYGVTNALQPSGDAQVPSAALVAGGGRIAFDNEDTAELEQPAEPEHIAVMSDDEQTKEGWDLYIVEYPPTQGTRSSEDDQLDWTLDWSLEDLESERGSAVVGPQRGT